MDEQPITTPTETPPAPVVVTPAAPAPAVESPWHSSIFTEDGKFVPQWQNTLPAEYEAHRAMLANYKDFTGLAKGLADNMTAARAKPPGLVIPAADAPPEVQSAYQAELRRLNGVPDTVDGYKLEKPATLPAGLEWSDDAAKGFAAKAHELGLTQKQAAELLDYDMGRFSAAQQSQEAETARIQEHERGELIKRFGDKVDSSLALAARVAATHSLPNARELFDPKSPMFAGVDMVAAFVQIGGAMGEQKLVPGAAVNNMDPGTLANDIINNQNNPEYAAFRDANHPNAARVRAKVEELFKQASKVA